MDIKGILNHWIVKNVLLAIAFVLALVTLASVLLNLGTQHNKQIEVPDFTNMTWSDGGLPAPPPDQVSYGEGAAKRIPAPGRGNLYRCPAAKQQRRQNLEAGVPNPEISL